MLGGHLSEFKRYFSRQLWIYVSVQWDVYMCVCVSMCGQLLEELCLLNGWSQPQYHAISTLHDGLAVYACRVSTVRLHDQTRMWASAERDGRLVEYRWRPLFNATKFGWRPLLECHALTLPRRKTRWNLPGCPELPNRSQPLGQSSPYCENMWGRYCYLTSFFSSCRYMP